MKYYALAIGELMVLGPFDNTMVVMRAVNDTWFKTSKHNQALILQFEPTRQTMMFYATLTFSEGAMEWRDIV